MKNRMANERGLGIAIAAMALTVLLVTACAPPTTPSQGEEKIVEIGSLPSLTGGGASAEQPGFQGLMDYVGYFDEGKGIPGVTIKVAWIDVSGDMGRFISGYRKLVDRGVPVMQSNWGQGVEALSSQFGKDQIAFITGSPTGDLIYPPAWVFAFGALQGEAATAVFDYFMENWREERPPKLQFSIIDIPWGWGLVEEATEYAETLGFEVLPTEPCPYVILDAIPQLVRIRERKADLVYIQHVIGGGGPIMRDAERLGLRDMMKFAGSEWLLGAPLIKMVPIGIEGFLSPRSLPWVDETEVPGIRTMVDTQQRYHGKVYQGPEYIAGWVYGAIMCEAVKGALEEVGYENLDGAAVKRALERMSFDLDGVATFTYGPEDRRGTRDYAVYQVQGGKIVHVSDYREVPILVP